MTEWLFLHERSEVSENIVRQLEPCEIVRGCCRNIVRVRRKGMATWPTSPHQQGTLNRIVNHHLTTTLTSPHLTSEYYIYWHLHDFLRRWDLMSLFEFFEGTKIQVKLSGSAPWGIQSLCLTYNAISEKMFFKESAQTIQRLRVRLTVRPP